MFLKYKVKIIDFDYFKNFKESLGFIKELMDFFIFSKKLKTLLTY
jgi:hypothetical protein